LKKGKVASSNIEQGKINKKRKLDKKLFSPKASNFENVPISKTFLEKEKDVVGCEKKSRFDVPLPSKKTRNGGAPGDHVKASPISMLMG